MLGVPDGAPGQPASLPMALARQYYKERGVLTESPTELVLTVLDLILAAARKGDAEWVRRGFQELLDSLDYRYEASWNLQALYEACLALVEQGELNEVASIMQEVRDAWADAFLSDSLSSSTSSIQPVQRSGFEGQA